RDHLDTAADVDEVRLVIGVHRHARRGRGVDRRRRDIPRLITDAGVAAADRGDEQERCCMSSHDPSGADVLAPYAKPRGSALRTRRADCDLDTFTAARGTLAGLTSA